MKDRKAVIPAAGLGTRMLPATKTVPKEMLPMVDKPVIQYIIEEAVAAGIEDILIVTNRAKSAMDDYFDYYPELETRLLQSGKESMLQMGNIVRNPRIWLPAILTSAITGPLATCLFRLEMNDPASAVASGMGTCGMVGPIGVYAGWVNDVATGAKAAITSLDWVGLALICFVLPAVLCWLFGLFFRRIGWIKEGDLTLE